MDKRTAEKLTKVHPELSRRIAQLIANLTNLGLDVRVTDGLRTFAEQDVLFRKRPPVTHARAGQSNHNYGLAVDVCPFKNNLPDYENLKAFQIIGREAKLLGLEWGGDWKFTDMPHVQLRGLSIKECQKLSAAGGTGRVWQRMYEILGGAKPEIFIPQKDDLLEFGDKGAEITALQTNLAKLNLLRRHEIDGEFGVITKTAVVAFQRQNNLTADGIVGPGTLAKIKTALEVNSKTFQNLPPQEIDTAAASIQNSSPDQPATDASVNKQTMTADSSGNVELKRETSGGSIFGKLSEKADSFGATADKAQTVLSKFGDISLGSIVMQIWKQILGVVLLVIGFLYNNPEWVAISVIIFIIAAWLWNESRKRRQAEKFALVGFEKK